MGRRRSRGYGGKKSVDMFILISLFIIYGMYQAYIYITNLTNKAIATVSSFTIGHWAVIGIMIILTFYLIVKYNAIKRRKAEIAEMNYKLKIEEARRKSIIKTEEERRKRVIKEGNLKRLKEMEPFAFEKYIADLFRLRGYDAQVTNRTGDGGKDIILKQGESTYLVECKRYNVQKVTRPDIQKFHSAVIDCNAVGGYYITTGSYTAPAQEYANGKPIQLLDADKLVDMILEVTSSNDIKNSI